MSVNKILSDGSIVPFAGTPNARISGFQDILNNNGAKNLLDIEGWFKSRNVTYTEVADNSYSVSDIGTSYGQPLALFDTPTDIIISGDITQGARYTNFRIQLYDTDGVARDFFGGNEVKVSGVDRIRLNYATSTTSTDYPVMTNIMIRRASDVDSTFEPYAMTNRELTKNLFHVKTVLVTFPAGSIDYWFTIDEIANVNGVIVSALACYGSSYTGIQHYNYSLMVNTDQYGRLGMRLSSAPSSSFPVAVRVIWADQSVLA